VQEIFNAGYRFAKPPNKPRLRAVAGDKKVTLYWDSGAEDSIDPLTRTNDFEGYAIYRSTDHEFSDQQTITDVNGSRFLFRPLTNSVGVEARFDLKNGITGPSPIPYKGRGISYDLGDDTGLFHTYVDSNNVVNGQTYYYTVVAYDRGFAGNAGAQFIDGIPPSETSKTITFNPTTDDYIFDLNTVSVTPAPRVAGYTPPAIGSEEGALQHAAGDATGQIDLRIIDPMAVPADGAYRIEFDGADGEVTYSLINDVAQMATLSATPGRFMSLGFTNIVPETFTLATSGRTLQAGTDYELNAAGGSVLVNIGVVEAGDELMATFKYAPIMQSDRLNFEESNPIVDGIHVFVQDVPLAINDDETGWSQGGRDIPFTVQTATSGPGRVPQPADYEITFSDSPVTEGFNSGLPLPFRIVNLTRASQPVDAFVPDINRNGVWDVNEQVIFVEEVDGRVIATWEVRFDDIGQAPGNGDVFYVRTDKPFRGNDTFTFTTQGAAVDTALETEELREVYVVPNPYVATNEIEPRNPASRSQRGDRRLYFANVPAQCTIRIYTVAGELVDTIEHSSTLDDGKAFWDLRTKDNMNIAYGLYLFHVESAEGTFIGKFAVIK